VIGGDTALAQAQSNTQAVTRDGHDETPGSLATVAWAAVAALEISAAMMLGLGLFAAMALFGWVGAALAVSAFILVRLARPDDGS
jgi:hypothetical protein